MAEELVDDVSQVSLIIAPVVGEVEGGVFALEGVFAVFGFVEDAAD